MTLTQQIAWLLIVAIALQLLLQHSNVDIRVGPFKYILALAPAHRFHHLNSARDGDVNFGLFTMIWDWMLGSALDCSPQSGPMLGARFGHRAEIVGGTVLILIGVFIFYEHAVLGAA